MLLTARMRARYWAAMGFAAVPIAACTKEQPPTTTVAQPDPTTTTVASASATATATASESASAAPIAAKSAPADVRAGPSRRMPMCPTGNFCVAQPAHVAADAGAPAPYGKCAASVPMPGDAGVFGSPYVSFDEEGTKDARAKDSKACCYRWVIPCPGGRPLRDEHGETLVASAKPREDWLDRALLEAARCDERERAALAERWTREAAFEHASIASFARATLELLALGAPSSLVADAQRAGLDEVEHARVAFALASAFSGRAIGPGPLPQAPARETTLRAVVAEAISEGCIGEAAAALSLREEAARSNDAMRAILGRIADDEERHAALAYATVAWAASVDAETTARVIDEELARARNGVHARVVREIAEPCLRGLARITSSSLLA